MVGFRESTDCMNDMDFHERFDGLINDYSWLLKKHKPVTNTLQKMHTMIGKYLKSRERDLYRDKSPENGAD
jgi:hypothetical protein